MNISKKIMILWFLAVTLYFLFLSADTQFQLVNFIAKIGNITKYIHKKREIENGMKNTSLKYILQWTNAAYLPFKYLKKGREVFVEKKCPYTNCFITNDRQFFGEDITKFDVIAFAGPEINGRLYTDFPTVRSPHQKYVFASMESSDNYPVCSNRFDGYFNWTWTFRLDSEVRWGYIIIRNKNFDIVGPQKNMDWIRFEDMDPVSDTLKEELSTKTKAVAWFVSHCESRSKREVFVHELRKQLLQYELTLDIYGKCGPFYCSLDNETACFDLIKEKYYFYLAFENGISEDYVTEKLLNAVQHYTVPIVYGGADYKRFLPENSYLNAIELGAEYLAAKINNLIKNQDEYFEYFRWTKYYTYHRKTDNVETDEYCQFCAILNDERMVKKKSVHRDFRTWWDPPHRCWSTLKRINEAISDSRYWESIMNQK